MKTFEVEMERISYITVTVEAMNEDHAEALAWQKIETGEHKDNDAQWRVESIEEVFS